jgi:hypothetical protein
LEDQNAPATKGDIAQLRAEIGHQYNDLVERIADSQPALLKAFYGYAEGNNKRVAELEGNEAAVRSRLGTLETRLLEVEKRRNMPPGGIATAAPLTSSLGMEDERIGSPV